MLTQGTQGRRNLNSHRSCPVCTGLPDNNVYLPDPMVYSVQYVALTRLTYVSFSQLPEL